MFGNYAAFGLLHFGVQHFGNYGLVPVVSPARPSLHRVPGESRLAHFTEIVASIVTSLSGQGQLLFKGQAGWTLNTVYLSVVDPTSADDSTLGHFAGQLWANIATQAAWLCFSALPGSVVWLPLGFSSNDVDSGIGPPAPAQGNPHDVYFDVSDPTNPVLYFKS